MLLDTSAAGRIVMNFHRPFLGNAYGNKMDGKHTFESPPSTNAGSVEELVGCVYGTVGSVTTSGGNPVSLQIQPYSGGNAAGYVGSRSLIGAVRGVTCPTGASVDSLVYCDTTDSVAVGEVSISSVNGSCAGAFGIFLTCGKLRINQFSVTGNANHSVVVSPTSSSSRDPEFDDSHYTL